MSSSCLDLLCQTKGRALTFRCEIRMRSKVRARRLTIQVRFNRDGKVMV
jgi:hypothetical protein